MIATGTKHLSSRRRALRFGACLVAVLTAGTVSAVSPTASADSPVGASHTGLPAGVGSWSELFSPTRTCSNGVAFADVTRGMEILPGMHVLTE